MSKSSNPEPLSSRIKIDGDLNQCQLEPTKIPSENESYYMIWLDCGHHVNAKCWETFKNEWDNPSCFLHRQRQQQQQPKDSRLDSLAVCDNKFPIVVDIKKITSKSTLRAIDKISKTLRDAYQQPIEHTSIIRKALASGQSLVEAYQADYSSYYLEREYLDFFRLPYWLLFLNHFAVTLDYSELLRDAIINGHLHVVEALITLRTINLNRTFDKNNYGYLHLATINHHVDIVETLLNAGADPLNLTSQSNIALHYACQYGFLDLVQMLVRAENNEDSSISGVSGSDGDGDGEGESNFSFES